MKLHALLVERVVTYGPAAHTHTHTNAQTHTIVLFLAFGLCAVRDLRGENEIEVSAELSRQHRAPLATGTPGQAYLLLGK